MRSKIIRFIALYILTACSLPAQNKNAGVLAYESHVNIAYGQKMDIVQMMKLKGADGFYVVPEIPEKKLHNASERCILPQGEEVLALIDATVAGHAKNCMLIGTSGIYIKNGSVADAPGRFFIPYASFKTMPIALSGKYEISIGEIGFDMSGASPERNFVITLLQDLQKKL